MNGKDFLFSITDTTDGTAVFITSKNTWEEEGKISQEFDNREMEILDPILEKSGLSELMAGCYEMTKSSEETKDLLLEEGLMEDKIFDNLIETLYS